MKLQLTACLLIALGLSMLANAFLGWQWAQSGAECETTKATAVVVANTQVRKDEGERDTKLDRVTAETQTDTRNAVAEVQEDARDRTQAIDRVVVRGDCRRPDGLPSLDAAVDQARAAAGH
ncbi:hypothetical protein [Novilysobacter erysipheiresistens]|uniref:DUF4124 domain-containing protein n=1 Tax=Novilysobacter erysipheiresistens TaxID=1749332 RepID=A0ABU7YUW8_9GAMM